MKKFFPLLLSLVCLSQTAQAQQQISSAKEITYDWLVEQKYGEMPLFRRIIEEAKPKVMLEFGVGMTTKYFLDSCTKVLSVEFITNGCGPERMKKFLSLYQGLSNWIPIAYFSGWPADMNWAPYRYLGSDKVYKATSYGNATGKSYALIDDLYLTELKVFLTNLAKSNRLEFVHVNTIGAYPLRGDIIQLLFGKAPVIFAPECDRARNATDGYSYYKVATPEDYEEIYFAASNSTVWIQKSEKTAALAAQLKVYAPNL